MMTKYDCCVIGTGTFGTKLANHLEQHGRDIIGDTAQTVEQIDDHAETLARMAQVYATTLAYTSDLGLSDAQQQAFLDLTSSAAQATTSIDDLPAQAATKAGFTVTTLETTPAITEIQRHQTTKLKEVLDDI